MKTVFYIVFLNLALCMHIDSYPVTTECLEYVTILAHQSTSSRTSTQMTSSSQPLQTDPMEIVSAASRKRQHDNDSIALQALKKRK